MSTTRTRPKRPPSRKERAAAAGTEAPPERGDVAANADSDKGKPRRRAATPEGCVAADPSRAATPEGCVAADPSRAATPEGCVAADPSRAATPEGCVAADPSRAASLKLLAFLAVVWTAYVAKAVLFPIVLAVILYFLLSPLTRVLCRLRIPPVFGAGVVVLGGLLVIGTGIYFLFLPASEMIADLPETLRKADRKLWFILKPLDDVNKASSQISKLTQSKDAEGSKVPQVQVRQPPLTYVLFNLTGGVVVGAVVVVILLYLLLATAHRTLNSIIELIPGLRHKQGVVRMIRNVEMSISTYLLTVTVINVCLGVVIASVMALLCVPNPILIGVMAATLNYVPYLGCMVGTAITFLVAVVALPSAGEALLPPLCYLGINSLEGNLLTPMILGERMSMNPVLVFLSLILWGWLWGVGGVLIAVPMLSIAAIVCTHFASLAPVARFISGGGPLEPG